MDDCIFCKIASGAIKAEKIYEDEHVFAFLDMHPRSPGHVLVIPKKHYENITKLPREQVQYFFEATQGIVGMVKKALRPDGFTLGMNYDRASGQEVDHMHFHIMPRWYGDGGHSLQSVVANEPKEDIQTIGNKIRATV